MKDKPEKATFLVRFIFGGLFGLIMGFGWWIYFDPNSTAVGILCILTSTILAGLLAAFLGDKFWTDFWWSLFH